MEPSLAPTYMCINREFIENARTLLPQALTRVFAACIHIFTAIALRYWMYVHSQSKSGVAGSSSGVPTYSKSLA